MILLAGLPALCAGPPAGNPTGAPSRSPAAIRQAYAQLPLSFEPNQGQTDPRVRFLAHGDGYKLFLTTDEAVLALNAPGGAAKQTAGQSVVRLKLAGVDASASATGEGELAGKSNYFIGNDPSRWQTNVPHYAQVLYRGIYPGIDVRYYGRQRELEYDFLVAAAADPSRIRFRISGATNASINGSGELVLETAGATVVLHRPEAHEANAGAKPIAARYVRTGRNEYGFALGPHRRHRALVIDPALTYSTYVGGSGGDIANAIGVDSSGRAIIAGVTNSTNFPTANAAQKASGGNGDAFISELGPDGKTLVYSSYLGGTGSDSANALAVDSKGDVFLTGTTTSTDFPVLPIASSGNTAQAFQTVNEGNGDAFVAELSSTGSSLVYSSYLGGSGADFGQAIAVDSAGNAYVTGSTQSADFPTLNPLQPTLSGSSDAFVAKVNFSGTALVYSTYLGGSQADTGQGIKIDSSANAYVAGYTFSSDFPVLNALQPTLSGDADVFVAEINPDGSAVVFSTFLGGTARDRAFGLALDSSGNIYVAGDTLSSDFPTTSNVFQAVYGGNGDAFLAKLNAGGGSLAYSTFIGGSDVDQGNAVALDSSGNAVVVGFTQSSDFPLVDPLQSVLGLTGGGTCGTGPCADVFVAKVNPTGSECLFSTYLGGSGADFGQGVAVDSSGNDYVTGSTSSSNYPAIAGAYQASLGGVAGNAFVAKIEATDAPAISLSPAKLNFGNQTVSVRSSNQTVTVANLGSSPLSITQITPPTTDFTETDNCVGTVAARGGTCTINVSFTPAAVGSVTDQITITDNASGSPHTITVTGSGVTQATAVTVAPTSLAFSNLAVSSVSAAQTVTITNTGSATLNINSITVTGDFTQTNTCAAMLNVLEVGQSCSVDVSFAPTATGIRNGTLSIADNATGSPQIVALSGDGLPQFSLSAAQPTVSTIIGSTSTTYMVSASAANSFTGSITLSCSAAVTCSFSPASIFSGQTSTLTVSGLSASTQSPFNFTVNGISGSQTATLTLTVLLQTFTLSVSPALNTVVAGSPAAYTVLVNPVNGFNQQVNLSCTNLPVGATCAFSPGSTTPNGTSPSSVSLTINTTKSARVPGLWSGSRNSRRWILLLAGAWVLLAFGLVVRSRRQAAHGGLPPRRTAWQAGLALAILSLLIAAGCRGISSQTSATPTGNYIITITGTLNSNSVVRISTTVDLAVT